mmetsp:Transcript_20043/g.20379  ORF Transcript_20043/g.20379 Transcript_20043/m.20379 type:complete len:122 (+) Transcript_20043:509-874(+)
MTEMVLFYLCLLRGTESRNGNKQLHNNNDDDTCLLLEWNRTDWIGLDCVGVSQRIGMNPPTAHVNTRTGTFFLDQFVYRKLYLALRERIRQHHYLLYLLSSHQMRKMNRTWIIRKKTIYDT